MGKQIKLPDEVQRVLDEADVDYRVEHRSNHAMLYIEGERAATISRGTSTKRRSLLNTVADVKRCIRTLQAHMPAPPTITPSAPAKPQPTPQITPAAQETTMNNMAPTTKRASPDYKTVNDHPSIDRLIKLLGYATAAEAIGMTDGGLRNAISNGKVRHLYELAARGALVDLEGTEKPAGPRRVHFIVSGDEEDMNTLAKIMPGLGITAKELHV